MHAPLCVCSCVVPSAPRALSSLNVTKFDIGVTWQRPDPPNGFIIEYTVSRMELELSNQGPYLQNFYWAFSGELCGFDVVQLYSFVIFQHFLKLCHICSALDRVIVILE